MTSAKWASVLAVFPDKLTLLLLDTVSHLCVCFQSQANSIHKEAKVPVFVLLYS